MIYERRIIDDELDELLAGLPAIAIEGPKAVGKTATALQRARTVFRLDDPAHAAIVLAEPERLVAGQRPILIDEWQRLPQSWDVVRRAVDRDQTPGQFILTGSASPLTPATHSGAGRIVRLRMRPLSLAERRLENCTVSTRALLSGTRSGVTGDCRLAMQDYVHAIVASGFPGLRELNERLARAQLSSYIDRVVDHDFEEMGRPVRKPEYVRRWLAAYAAATATTTTLEKIRDAASPGEEQTPARTTATTYRNVLQRLWLLDPVQAWLPSRNYFSRLTHPDKHHLADVGLAAVLLGVGTDALLDGDEPIVTVPRDGTLLGHLFESLVAQSIRVYAQAAEAEVRHLRTKGGRQEVDLILERRDHRIVAVEVKLKRTVDDADVRHLLWLREQMGDDLLDAVVVTTGPSAYRRDDGIAVVPAALLGP